MTVTVRIPSVMRASTGTNATVECSGDTVAEVISDLVKQHSDIGDVLFDAQGNLHKYVNMYLESDDIRYIGGLEAPIGEAKELTILPAVAGGFS